MNLYNKKISIFFLVDIFVIILCFFLSLYFRLNLDFSETISYLSNHVVTILLLLFTHWIFIHFTQTNILEIFSLENFYSVFLNILAISLVLSVSSFFIFANLPRSIPIIFFFLASSIMIIQKIFIYKYYMRNLKNKDSKNVFLFGAGSTGLKFLNYYFFSKSVNIVGFIDDNIDKQRAKLQNKKILSRQEFIDLVISSKNNINEVWITCSSLSKEQKDDIKIFLKRLNLKFTFLDQISDILEKNKIVDHNKIDLEEIIKKQNNDKLGFDSSFFQDKCIVVTGAGGSIGSEITRQLLTKKVKKLILIDINELNLFLIERNIKYLNNEKIDFEFILGSIENSFFVKSNLKGKKIDLIINAAAYKHVDLVEKNKFSGLKNNLIGTYNLCELAISEKVGSFLLISTDKAVEPSSFMGLTKRLCELLVLYYGRHFHQVNFSSVRFGNVIGSSGSVIPIFIDQIRQGKSLLITHKDIKRYFMTIEEASELVLYSMTLNIKNNICYLDMGEQKKILDIAKKLIMFYGFDYQIQGTRNKNKVLKNKKIIKIEFTKMKKGEKIEEKLLNSFETSNKIDNTKIFSIKSNFEIKDEIISVVDYIKQSQYFDEKEFRKRISKLKI